MKDKKPSLQSYLINTCDFYNWEQDFELKNNLKEILKNRGIKQTYISEKANISRQTLSNIINNRFNPSIELAFRLALILDMEITDIFSYIEKDNK